MKNDKNSAGGFRSIGPGFLFLAAFACTTWSQTPTGAIFNHTNEDQGTFTEYIDMTAGSGYPLMQMGDNSFRSIEFPITQPRGSSAGVCVDYRFFSQAGAPPADWSLWYPSSNSNPTYLLASAHVDGQFPRWRVWIGGSPTAELPYGSHFRLKSPTSTTNPNTAHGAGWMQTRFLTGLTQVQCENVSYPTARLVRGVWTKIR